MALGKAVVNITANLAPLKRGLAQARTAITSMVKRAGSMMRSGLTSGFRAITAGLSKITRAAKIAAAALIGVVAASVKIASTSQETANLFGIAMGDMVDEAEDWVQQYSKARNLFDSNTRKMVATLGIMLKSMGFTQKEAFDMSKTLVKASVDIKSAYEIPLTRAFDKVKSGLVGQTEPLQSIGILTGEAAMKAEALKDENLKLVLSTGKVEKEFKRYGSVLVEVEKKAKSQKREFTDLEKVYLRYKAILSGAKLANDDFLNTLNSTSNVFTQISEQVQRTGETIGQVFQVDVTNAGKSFRDWLVNNQDQIKEWADFVRDKIQDVIAKIKEYIALAKSGNFEAIFKDLGNVFSTMKKGLEAVFEKLKPIAVDVGKQIGMGLWSAVADTPLGKFLSKTSDIAGTAGRVIEKINRPGDALRERGVLTPSMGGFSVIADEIKKLSNPMSSAVTALTPRSQARQESGQLDAMLLQDTLEIQKRMLSEVKNLNRTVSGDGI